MKPPRVSVSSLARSHAARATPEQARVEIAHSDSGDAGAESPERRKMAKATITERRERVVEREREVVKKPCP